MGIKRRRRQRKEGNGGEMRRRADPQWQGGGGGGGRQRGRDKKRGHRKQWRWLWRRKQSYLYVRSWGEQERKSGGEEGGMRRGEERHRRTWDRVTQWDRKLSDVSIISLLAVVLPQNVLFFLFSEKSSPSESWKAFTKGLIITPHIQPCSASGRAESVG